MKQDADSLLKNFEETSIPTKLLFSWHPDYKWLVQLFDYPDPGEARYNYIAKGDTLEEAMSQLYKIMEDG